MSVRLGEQLQEKSLISASDLRRALTAQQEQGGLLGELLVRLGFVRESELLKVLATQLGVDVLDEKAVPESPLLADVLKADFLRQARVLPVSANDDYVAVAMAVPQDDFTRTSIEMAVEKPLTVFIAAPSEIERQINRLYVEDDAKDEEELSFSDSDDSIEHLRDMASEAPVIRTVNQMITRAVEMGASDIHLEPFEETLALRYRVDGILHEQEPPQFQMTSALISRLKIMGKLNIAERRLPQDGRIKLRVQGKEIDLRVSTVPTLYGESVVMRILDRDSIRFDLSTMGFNQKILQQFNEVLSEPHGILLVTGPTGSGKTTTLYAALNQINQPERKIITVEDPVEYQLVGINQIQVSVKAGLTFSSALRAIVRQDPDVIMLGEMRDLETAQIAIQSALTGHMVLSTLHTNDAPSAVTRLLDMGVEDYLITSTVNGVLAQRLVRCLCDHCKQSYKPSAALLKELRVDVKGDEQLYKAVGCEHCGQTGFSGRTIIHEMLKMTDVLREAVMQKADASTIIRAAKQQGMVSMAQDGIEKALQGITTIEEILRVTRESEDAAI